MAELWILLFFSRTRKRTPQGGRTSGMWGLILLQLGIRAVKSFCYQALSLPFLPPIPWVKIFPVCASLKKHAKLDRRIEFSKVISFSY